MAQDVTAQDWSYGGIDAPAPSVAGMPNAIDSMTPPAARDKAPSNVAGDPSERLDKLNSEFGAKYQSYMDTEKRIQTDNDNRDKVNRDRLEKQFNAESHEADNIPSWNEQQQAEKFATHPVQAFGSMGVIFATLASAFTHTPMINALNGSAAAINAMKEGNDEQYKKAFDAWKQNTDLAVKRQEMQHQTYEDAFKLFDTDHAIGAAKLKEAANRFQDEQVKFLLDNGLYDKIGEAMLAREKTKEGLKQINWDDADRDARHTAVVNKLRDIQQQTGRPPTPEETIEVYAASQSVGKPGSSPEANVFWDHVFKNPDDVEGAGKAAQAMRMSQGSAEQRLEYQLYQNLESARTSGDPQALAQAKQQIADYQEMKTHSAKLKIDQAIVNQLPEYPGMSEDKLGFIPPAQQTKLKAVFDSAKNLEDIAGFVRDNPESLGILATASKNMNLDAYQSLFGADASATDQLKSITEQARDEAIDAVSPDATQASKAKILNKLLTSQAFADATTAGARGGSIYLDRAFREIYQQSSSPEAFFGILRKRYEDADRLAEDYGLGFNKRTDKASMPFWNQGPESYAHGSKASASGVRVSDVIEGEGGKKYVYKGGDPHSKDSYTEVPMDTPVTKRAQ